MFKNIFNWVILIISQPGKAWDTLSKKEEKTEDFLEQFLYPLVGLVTITAFLGVLFTQKEFSLELALKSSIRTLVSTFGGFYLSAYIMNEVWKGFFKRESDMPLWQRFVGYSSALMFALNVLLTLLPEFFFLRIFILYTFYIIWEGAVAYLKVEDVSRLKFTSITTAVVLLTPIAIELLLSLLMPGLSF